MFHFPSARQPANLREPRVTVKSCRGWGVGPERGVIAAIRSLRGRGASPREAKCRTSRGSSLGDEGAGLSHLALIGFPRPSRRTFGPPQDEEICWICGPPHPEERAKRASRRARRRDAIALREGAAVILVKAA